MTTKQHEPRSFGYRERPGPKVRTDAELASQTLEANRIVLATVTGTAAKLYHDALHDRELGGTTRRWYKKRGIHGGTRCEWELGAAPAAKGWLLKKLREIFTEVALRHSGLFIFDEEKGEEYDRFRRRAMLPVCDVWGAVVSLTGRATNEETYPKYAGTPNTIIFNKQSALFGLDQALPGIIAEGKALVVEGQLDALMLHQHGITNAVALMGGALVEHHLHKLGRWCERVTFLADGDEGGLNVLQKADSMKRKTAMRDALDVELKLVRVPADEGDPDSYIRKHGADEFRKALELWEAVA